MLITISSTYYGGGHILLFLAQNGFIYQPVSAQLLGSQTSQQPVSALVTVGVKGSIAMADVCNAPRFWEHHPMVPREALRLRILLSYHYFKDTDLDTVIPAKFPQPYPQIFADSGAFSSFTQGVTIRWQDYAAWLKRYCHWFVTMANLDVIGNWQETARHQQCLEQAGLPVLPVFHTGEPWCVLERLVERYPYIALGGMVAYARDWKTRLMPWLIRCFKIAGTRTGFHGFGCTAWEVMKALPWRSVDSSSWGQGFRYGQVPIFEWQRGRFVECQLGDAKSVGKVASSIRALGFAPEDFASRTRNTRLHNCGIAALSYCLASAWLQQRWQKAHAAFLVDIPPLSDSSAAARICASTFLVDGKAGCGDTAPAGPLRAAVQGAAPIYLADTSAFANPKDASHVLTGVQQQRASGGGIHVNEDWSKHAATGAQFLATTFPDQEIV